VQVPSAEGATRWRTAEAR